MILSLRISPSRRDVNAEHWEQFGMELENKDSKYSVSAIGSSNRKILESGFKKDPQTRL